MLATSLIIVLAQLMGLVMSDDHPVAISLYDLTTDIYEQTDISEQTEYADTLSAFRSQVTELASKYYVEPIYANYDALQDSWDVNGGVGPWIESDAEPRTITQKYSSALATSSSSSRLSKCSCRSLPFAVFTPSGRALERSPANRVSLRCISFRRRCCWPMH